MTVSWMWLNQRASHWLSANKGADPAPLSAVGEAIGTCLDNASKLTFLQADFERIAQSQRQQAMNTHSQVQALETAVHETQLAVERAVQAVSQAREPTEAAQVSARQTAQRMAAVNAKIMETRALVEALSSRSSRIEQMVQSIEKIARETTLLAMNAKIEAARAGDNGRGFAVVADAVKRLSVQTNEATRGIQAVLQQTVQDVQRSHRLIGAVMQEVQDSTELAEEGERLSGEARAQALVMDESVQSIRQQMETMATANGLLREGVGAFTQVAEQVSETAGQARSAARTVLGAALNMKSQLMPQALSGRGGLSVQLLHLADMARAETVLALQATAPEVDAARQRIAAIDQRIASAVAARPSEPMLPAFDIEWARYRSLRDEALGLAAAGRSADAIAFTAQKNRPQFQVVRQLLLSQTTQ